MSSLFDQNISFLKGIGPLRADLLGKELNLFTYSDLLRFFPFRYEDRTKFYKVKELHENLPNVQLVGQIKRWSSVGAGRKQRLIGHFQDESGELDLVWFQGAKWV